MIIQRSIISFCNDVYLFSGAKIGGKAEIVAINYGYLFRCSRSVKIYEP